MLDVLMLIASTSPRSLILDRDYSTNIQLYCTNTCLLHKHI